MTDNDGNKFNNPIAETIEATGDLINKNAKNQTFVIALIILGFLGVYLYFDIQNKQVNTQKLTEIKAALDKNNEMFNKQNDMIDKQSHGLQY